MHIPENYLSPSTCAIMTTAMIPIWSIAVSKVKKELSPEKLSLLGVGAAFSFLGMMFNLPLPGGTTGHAVGGTLLAILIEPYAACLSVSVALLIQAIFFGDGGILSFGANCFNMAFVLPFTGYFVYSKLRENFGEFKASAVGAYVGINMASLCAAIEFGIQPLFFTNELGQALYCPYPLSISIPAMMIGHLTLFGLAEIIFTVSVLSYLKKVSPELLNSSAQSTKGISKAVYGLIIILVICTPIGLLAEGTAWGEWGVDEIAEVESNGQTLGYTPSGMENGFEFNAFFPDYIVEGIPDSFGYILSAVIGVSLLIIVFKLLTPVLSKQL